MILATLCYLKKDNKTLMMHRVKKKDDMHEGKWNGLGGKFEPSETPEECVIREIKEETGLDIVKPRLHGRIAFNDVSDESPNKMHVYVFTAREFNGNLISSKDSREGNLKWIPDDNLFDLNLWEGDKIFLRWLEEEHGFFSAKFVYDGNKLVDHSVVFH